TDTGKSLFTFSGMENDIMALAFSPDGKRVVSSGFETALYWWNTETGEQVKAIGGHSVSVHEIAFSKDGKRVISGGGDRTLRLWDGNTMAALRNAAVNSVIYAVAISPNGKLIASGTFDGMVRLHDEANLKQLASFLSVPSGEQADWLVMTPEGYTAASDGFHKLGRWRMKGQDVPGPAVWSALGQVDSLVSALRGDKVGAVKFEIKK